MNNEKRKQLINAANIIKDFCRTDGVYEEEECPLFRGYEETEQYRLVQCTLNLGETSPCNWKLEDEYEDNGAPMW